MLTDHLVGQRRRRGDVLTHDGRDLRVLLRRVGDAHRRAGEARVERVVHDHVVGARRHQLAGLVVDCERDVAEDPPERGGARDQTGHAARSDRAAVLVVRVGRHDHLDRRVEPRCDVGDRTAGEIAAAPVDVRRSGSLAAALVDDEHPRPHMVSVLLAPLHDRVSGIGLLLERQTGDSCRRDDRGGRFEHLAEEPNRELLPAVGLEPLGRVRGEQGLARRVHDHVGGQVLEIGARKDVRARTVRQSVGSGGAPIDRLAAAVLDAKQLGAALVELVVSDRGEVDVHEVRRDRDRLLEEEPVRQRAGADVVAGEEGRLLAVVQGLAVLHRLGEIGGTACEMSVDVVAGCFEVAVQVVEGQKVNIGRLTLLLRAVGDRDLIRERSRPGDTHLCTRRIRRSERRAEYHAHCDRRQRDRQRPASEPRASEHVSHESAPPPVRPSRGMRTPHALTFDPGMHHVSLTPA